MHESFRLRLRIPPQLQLILQSAVLAVALIFWIIALGGLSAAQQECNDNFSNTECYHELRFEWFQLFYQLFMVLGLAIAVVMATFECFKTLFLTLFVILTVLVYGSADRSITLADFHDSSEYNARAAGWILLALLDTAIVMALSVDFPPIVPQTYGDVNNAAEGLPTSTPPPPPPPTKPPVSNVPVQEPKITYEQTPKPTPMQEVDLENDQPSEKV